MSSDGAGKSNGHGISYLFGDLDLRTTPLVALGEVLQQRRLVVRDDAVDAPSPRTMIPLRVKVLTLLGLEELSANGEGRRIPAHASHDVGRARLLVTPAPRQQVVWDIEPPAAGRNAVVTGQGERSRVTPHVKVGTLEHTRDDLPEECGLAVGQRCGFRHFWKPGDSAADRLPGQQPTDAVTRVGRLRQGNLSDPRSEHDRARPALGHAVIC